MKTFRLISLSHSGYIFLTGLWPIVDIGSFMMVTGPKTDVWLVKTVGALLIPVAMCLLSFILLPGNRLSAIILGAGIAISFVSIDLYYALTDVISDIYLADAFVELAFLMGWIYLFLKKVEVRSALD